MKGPSKIAVVGCGAVGSFYGAKLARAGHELHFLLRSDCAVVRSRGVSVRSPLGDFTVRPRCAKVPEEIGPVDLVLIGLKATANEQFKNLLPPLVGPGTVLLTLQNGLGNEDQLARLFAPEQIMGGLCFVCLNRVEPGVIDHIAHGLVVVGDYVSRADARAEVIASMFREAGVPCRSTDNLARTHWEKLVWNIPFNGLGVAGAAGYDAVVAGDLQAGTRLGPCVPTDQLLADPQWEQLVRELMHEVIAAARALGFDLPASLAEFQVERTRTMGAYRASTLIDFERGQPLELESLFLEPLRQANRAGVKTPRLAALCSLLRKLDAAPRLGGLSSRYPGGGARA